MTLSDLPAFNAFMNSLSAICLISGFIAIKNQNKVLHKRLMITAFIFSTIFLTSYVTYHFNHPTTIFPELGWIKTAYLIFLLVHVVLAVVMLPMIFLTFFHAFKGNFDKHKKIAKPTFGIWLYVSVTGVLIYFMLYHWFAS